MSYDIELVDPITRKVLMLDEPHQMRGGTYPVGGESRCRLNVTYNYYPQFVRVLGELDEPRPLAPDWMREDGGTVQGIRTIYGLTGAESIPVLDDAISKLGDDVSDRYWDATDGNAKRALMQLRALATMRPDGLWEGD